MEEFSKSLERSQESIHVRHRNTNHAGQLLCFYSRETLPLRHCVVSEFKLIHHTGSDEQLEFQQSLVTASGMVIEPLVSANPTICADNA